MAIDATVFNKVTLASPPPPPPPPDPQVTKAIAVPVLLTARHLLASLELSAGSKPDGLACL